MAVRPQSVEGESMVMVDVGWRIVLVAVGVGVMAIKKKDSGSFSSYICRLYCCV